MNELKETEDFVKMMLAHEPLLNPTDLESHRVRVLERLGRAERHERLGRRVTLCAVGAGFGLFALLCAAVSLSVSAHLDWPDWALTAAAMFVILFPAALLLLAAIYLSRHRRELFHARDAAQRQALLELQSQVEDLKRRLSATPPETGAAQGGEARG
jgi:hypothetical protein